MTGPHSSPAQRGNPLRNALADHHTIIGTWVISTDASTVDVLSQTAIDLLAFDCQHGPHSLDSIGPLLRVANDRGKATLVRTAASDPWMVMRALDLGAAGVIIPLINDVEEAAAAYRATRYPPFGVRSYGPFSPAAGDPFDPQDGPLLLPMIETSDALAAASAIAGLDGVDGLFVGPIDLAYSVGALTDGDIPSGLASVALADAVATIAAAARTSGALLAGAVFSPEHARGMAAAGMRLQILGTDTGWLTAGAARTAALAAELSDHTTPTNGDHA